MKTSLRILTVATLAATALALGGCSSAPGTVVGTWGDPDANAKPWMTFEEDGSYSGNDGCNGLGGNWTEEGGTVDLGQMRSTLMFCEGVDTWLSLAAEAKLDGDTLTFTGQDGSEIGELTRSKG